MQLDPSGEYADSSTAPPLRGAVGVETNAGLGRRMRELLAPRVDGEAAVAAAPSVPVAAIFRRFWPYARPNRRWLGLSLLFAALTPAIETGELLLFKLAIDRVLVPHSFAPLAWIAPSMVGLFALGAATATLDEYLSTWVGERFVLSLRSACFEHLHGLSLDFFDRRRLGDTVARLTGDVGAVESLVVSSVTLTVSYVVRAVLFTAALFWLRWDLAAVALVVAPLFWFVARRFTLRIKEASREKRRRLGAISAVAEESLANAALVQAYNRRDTERERFERENLGSFAAELRSARLKALFGALVDLIDLVGFLIVIALGTWELRHGRLTLGGLFAFIAYLSRLYRPIRGLSRLNTTVYAASAGAERIIELFDQRPSVQDDARARSLGRAVGRVEFESVSFAYPGADHDALTDVSFVARPGEVVALVGPSGAGKSTIAKLLLRFYDVTTGAVLVDGEDVRMLRLDSLRDNVGVLLQETLTFSGTVRENIAYGKRDATHAEIAAAAAAADADVFIDALPEGYDTSVRQRGRRLSGGQRQRLAIARAMIRDAPVLVLDEPTTGLDAESGARMLEVLGRLMADRTTIVIAHNLLTVRRATSIVVLDEGHIVERGTHDDLVDRDGLYARLWRAHGDERVQRGSVR